MKSMRNLCLCVSLTFGLMAGCATPPPAGPDSSQVIQYVHLAAASMEVVSPATLPVEDTLAGAHDVDFYVRIALERNPEILAAQRNVAAQSEVIPQVTALADPMLTDTFQPITGNSVQTAAGRGPNLVTLSQRFPWFSKLRVRGEVAEQETKMALARLAQSQLKVIETVKLSYYELYFNQRAIEITKVNKSEIDKILKFVDARFRATRATLEDVLRARIEQTQVKNRLISLERQLRQTQADLAKDLHTSPQADLKAKPPESESAPKEIDCLYEAAVRCRPELQERLHAIVRDQRVMELAKLNYYPDFNVGIGWQDITRNNALAGVANGNDNLAFTVGVTIPIWRDKLRAGVRESEHRMVATARRYDSERDDTFRRIRRLIVQARSLESQIELLEEGIIPDSKSTVTLLFAKYQVAKVDIQDVIDNFTRLLNFEIQLVRLKANLGQTLASLERVIGCQLVTLEETPTSPPRGVVPPAPVSPAPVPGDAKPPTEKKPFPVMGDG